MKWMQKFLKIETQTGVLQNIDKNLQSFVAGI
jgi:hypothetical protein